MDQVEVAATPISTLRRRNSIGTRLVVPSKLSLLPVPTKLQQASSLPSSSDAGSGTTTSTNSSSSSSDSSTQLFPVVDFELVSIKPSSYTSLKDLLPSTAVVHSPTASAIQSGYEISIRNRLVKQAAWAYLQPMSTSPESSGRSFIHCLWTRLSADFAAAVRFVSSALDRILRAVRVRSSR